LKSIQDSIDVAVPVTTAYNQWTQVESFPAFMFGVEQVSQITETRTHWRTRVAGAEREFDAEITEQHPDERIAWRTVDGVHHSGVVTFHRLDDRRTRIMLQLEFAPEGIIEKAGAALGVLGRQTEGDLARFKEFIESEGTATGAWRGDVARPPQTNPRQTETAHLNTAHLNTAQTGTAHLDTAQNGTAQNGTAGSRPPTGQRPSR
jgi:uncharacterized membrane protein